MQTACFVECQIDPVRVPRAVIQPFGRKLDLQHNAFLVAHRSTPRAVAEEQTSSLPGGTAFIGSQRGNSLLPLAKETPVSYLLAPRLRRTWPLRQGASSAG